MKRFSSALLIALLSTSAHALDIGGYTVRQTNTLRNYTIPSTNVSAGGYIVIGRSATKTDFQSYWGVTLATNVIYLNAANNFPRIDGLERFSLLNSGGTNIDGLTPSSIDPLNKSVQRKNATNSASSSASWNVVTWSSATPGSGCAGNGTAGLRISEYADAGSFQYEFVELFYDGSGMPSNIPPVLFPIPNKTITVSNNLQFTVEATPTDGDDYTLSASNLPSGAIFPVVTNGIGTFTWSSPSPIGVYTAKFYAIDNDGVNARTVTVSVLDKPTLSFGAPEYTVAEDAGTQLVQIVLSRQADATVQVAVVGGTAMTNDFSLSATTVVFSASGPTQITFGVIVTNDSLSESMESILLAVTNPASASLAAPAQIAVYIRDNDAITIMTANLVTGSDSKYNPPGCRIMQGLKPDIVAIQEWNITNVSYRNFVDLNFGTNFSYYIEPQSTNYFPLPNGIISRWPITASGEWADPVVVNRDFAWATIDIPGDRNLHVVCLHLYASGTDADRAEEARCVTNYVATSGWPSNDYVVICGDLNLNTRTDPAMLVLTNIVSDFHKPADQNGDTDSNSNRTKPYDYVLPGRSLNSNNWPVSVGGLQFTNGIVFDSRLWTNPPPPILTNDSGAVNADHMAVMKAFSVGKTPPALQPVNNQRVIVNVPLQFNVHASPTDGDTVTLTASNLPAGASFNSTNENGSFTWADPSPVGVYTTFFYAADSDGIESERVLISVLIDGRVWVNEIHYDNAGTDTNEGVEIAGTAGMDLSLYCIATYDGLNGTLESTNPLSGIIDDEGCGYGAVWFPIANLQNGPDGFALVESQTNIVQFLSYEGTIVAVDGPAVELSSTDIGVSEAGIEAAGLSLQLTGGGTNVEAFSWAGPTNAASRGFLNSRQTIYPCGGSSNQPPLLFTIGNHSTSLSNLLTFAVTATDIDGDPITLTVSNAPGDAAFGSTGGNGTFTWTNPAPVGVYTTSFHAADDDGADSETILITVGTGTEHPVISAIANKSVILNKSVSFDVFATDAENDPITLTVSNAPAGSTFSSTNGNGSFSWAGASPTGTYAMTFYARDTNGYDTEAVTIYVTPPTNLPAIQAIANPWVLAGNDLVFGVTATDADGDAITLTASNLPAGASFQAAGGDGVFSWTNAAPVGTYTSAFYAADNDGVVSRPVVISVPLSGALWINEIHYDNAGTDTNEGVEIAGTAGIDLSYYVLYAYNGGDGLVYSSNGLSGVIDDEGCGYGAVWVPVSGLQNGPDGVALVLDGSNMIQFLSYEATIAASNGPAAGQYADNIKVSEAGTETDRSLQLKGVGTNYIQFSWGGPTNAPSRGALNESQWIYPCGGSTNQPPFLYHVGNRSVPLNNTLSFTVAATDVDNDPITLSVSNAPAGSTFDPGSGLFSWTNAAPVGVYTTSFHAADDDGADSETIEIAVQRTDTNLPVLQAIANKTVTESNTLQFAVVATEADGDPITLSVSNAPAGSAFSWTNGNGTFVWTNAGPVGVYTTVFYAVDKDGFDTESLTITVQPYVPAGTNSLAAYDFENGSGGFTNTAAGSHSNITASVYAPDDGTYTDASGNPGRAISDTGWTSGSRYYTFSITVAAGYQANLTGVQFQYYRSGTGPSNWILRCSSDGYATDLSSGLQTAASLWRTNAATFSLSALTGTVTFRIYGTNASSSAGTWRHDNVQLIGSIEPAAGTDADGDGLPNDWETLYFGDQTSGVPTIDTDTDTFNNVQEYIAGTDPTNRFSLFEADAVWTNLTGSVQFNSVTNRIYGLYYKTNLFDANWMPWLTNIAGSNVSMSIVITNRPDPSYFKPGVKLP